MPNFLFVEFLTMRQGRGESLSFNAEFLVACGRVRACVCVCVCVCVGQVASATRASSSNHHSFLIVGRSEHRGSLRRYQPTHAHTCTNTHTCVQTHTCVHTHSCTNIQHTHTFCSMMTLSSMYTCTYTQLYKHTHVQTHTPFAA